MNFPCILIEQPHQRSGRAWIANSAEEITGELAGNKYGDNWDSRLWASREEIADCYGEEADWPEELREAVAAGVWPIRHHTSPFGDWAGPEADADEMAFALDYIGHDLSQLQIAESAEEAERIIKAGGHNLPIEAIDHAMQMLGWRDLAD